MAASYLRHSSERDVDIPHMLSPEGALEISRWREPPVGIGESLAPAGASLIDVPKRHFQS